MTKFDQQNQKTGTQFNAETIHVYVSHSLEVLEQSKATLEEMTNLDGRSQVFHVVPDQEPSENTKKLIEEFKVAKKQFADLSRQEREENIKAKNSDLTKDFISMIDETSKCKLAEEKVKLSMKEWTCSDACEDEGIDPRIHGLRTTKNAMKNMSELIDYYKQCLKTLTTTIREVQYVAKMVIRNIRT